MERDDRQRLRAISGEVAAWVRQAQSLRVDRAKVEEAAQRAVGIFRSRAVPVTREGAAAWMVLPLRADDGQLLEDVAQRTAAPRLTPEDEHLLFRLTTDVSSAVSDVSSVVGARRFISGKPRQASGSAAAAFLSAYSDWAGRAGVADRLGRLSGFKRAGRTTSIAEAVEPRIGLAPCLRDWGRNPTILPAAMTSRLTSALFTITEAPQIEERFRTGALLAGNQVREVETRALLTDMPVDRLREATRDRLLVGPLTSAGIMTVQQVLDFGPLLETLPGIGAVIATRMRGAAHTLWQTTYDAVPTRIDIKKRTPETTEVLRRLSAWDAVRRAKGTASDLRRAADLGVLARALDETATHLVIFETGDWPSSSLQLDVDLVIRQALKISGTIASQGLSDPWSDFMARPADYFALLAELGFITEDESKVHGDLPQAIVDAVRALKLDVEYLSASLRGYQSFGARFAVVQRKVIIGDEMGLGKTVEALAVLAHLRAKGTHHFVVVCPAAVVTNWMREISAKSRLRPHRIHGKGREIAARSWKQSGGVGVTTFETLSWFENNVGSVPDLGCVVVDEAQYIKNPYAARTERTGRLIATAERALLLTGTPLENRLDEFCNLVGYVRPDLTVNARQLSAQRFRQQVAPAYLRRNQEDVLTELPELVEIDEWLPMSGHDATAYREAVWSRSFMAMRQAALSQGRLSEKMLRLIEIVGEAEANGRRVIVFSHFLSVLDKIARTLPGQVFGPLSGSVPSAKRQLMIDKFSEAGDGAVLVAQILAGGVGLNIQAASVVVICEPQLKPTTEWQAIARTHRMGQLKSVQVHRLLSEEGVDQRVTEILAHKRAIFNDFARFSDTAQSAPEAVDVSEADLAREVVAAERLRLFSIPL